MSDEFDIAWDEEPKKTKRNHFSRLRNNMSEKWLCYDTKPEVTWCDVRPEAHLWAAECAA